MSDILHLIIKKKWFDLIANGEKVFEYREYKPYWETRIDFRHYYEVHFRSDYDKGSPFMRVIYEHYTIIEGNGRIAENGEELTADVYFELRLGKVLEIKNWGN